MSSYHWGTLINGAEWITPSASTTNATNYRAVYYTPYTQEQLQACIDIENQMWYGTRGWKSPKKMLNPNIKIL